VSRRWLQRRRRGISWRRVQRRWHGHPSWRLSRRARVPRRHALRIPPRLSPAALLPPASLPSPLLRDALLRIPVFLWLPAPPLLPMLRRPVTEACGILGRCWEIDEARHDAAARLARQLADHIDEFRLVRHGRVPRESASQGASVRLAC